MPPEPGSDIKLYNAGYIYYAVVVFFLTRYFYLLALDGLYDYIWPREIQAKFERLVPKEKTNQRKIFKIFVRSRCVHDCED